MGLIFHDDTIPKGGTSNIHQKEKPRKNNEYIAKVVQY